MLFATGVLTAMSGDISIDSHGGWQRFKVKSRLPLWSGYNRRKCYFGRVGPLNFSVEWD
jgi:hypothetical protein